jgi:hypothetical protein
MSNKLAGGVKADSTSVRIPVALTKSADGTEQTATVASGVTASYWRQGGSRVAISVSDLGSVGAAWSSGGWKEVDATNMPGSYELDVPDAAFASGADWVRVTVKVASCFVENYDFALETQGAAETYTRLGAPAGASHAADVAAVKVDTASALTKLGTPATSVAADVAAISTKLGTPAGATVSADLVTIAAYVDTVETKLGTPVGASLSADIAAVQADTDNLQTRVPPTLVGGRISADVGSVGGSSTAATNLSASALGIVRGAAASGTLSTTQMTTDLTGATADLYVGRAIVWTGGAAAGQAATITDYVVSGGKLTYGTIAVAPTNGDTFVIV